MRLKRIPFDSLSLAICVRSIRDAMEGGKVQRVVTLDSNTFALAVYARGEEQWLLASIRPESARLHRLPKRPEKIEQADDFAKLVRANVLGSRVASIEQQGFDRLVTLRFESELQEHRLILELMGKHSNAMLVDPSNRIVACLKSVGPSKSKRPVTIGRTYSPPPLVSRKPIFEAPGWDDAVLSEGASPFLISLLRSKHAAWEAARRELFDRLRDGKGGFASAGLGGYAIDPSPLGYPSEPVPDLDVALALFFDLEGEKGLVESQRSNLRTQLERVELARSAAVHDLEQALDVARSARELQMWAELILSNLHEIREGQIALETFDYSGTPISIRLEGDKPPKEMAQKLFDKAKRAKSHEPELKASHRRLSEELVQVRSSMRDLELAQSTEEVDSIRSRALESGWLHTQRPIDKSTGKAIDPYAGHRIKSLTAPGNWTVLYGENATSNDFLTLRIAKPNDFWLHVRGSVSAHVVIQTRNQPDRVGIEALRFAAGIAVKNSSSKHSRYVPVDFTLKKYVRKPRGAPAGAAFYTNEKTLHIGDD